MTARDYGVFFGYGAYDGTWYTKARPHRGNDRLTPTGTDVAIGSTVIGQTGATGLVEGPHLHTQAGTDEWVQQTVDPTPHEFKGGTVVHVGEASEWGKYVIIRVGKVYVCYAHLSSIEVHEGQVIEEEEDMKATRDEVYWQFKLCSGNEPTEAEMKPYVGADYRWAMEDIKRFFANEGLDFQTFKKQAAVRQAELETRLAQADGSDAAKKLQSIRDALGVK